MSEQWVGPGWWIGGDGLWHPPRDEVVAPSDVPAEAEATPEAAARVEATPEVAAPAEVAARVEVTPEVAAPAEVAAEWPMAADGQAAIDVGDATEHVAVESTGVVDLSDAGAVNESLPAREVEEHTETQVSALASGDWPVIDLRQRAVENKQSALNSRRLGESVGGSEAAARIGVGDRIPVPRMDIVAPTRESGEASLPDVVMPKGSPTTKFGNLHSASDVTGELPGTETAAIPVHGNSEIAGNPVVDVPRTSGFGPAKVDTSEASPLKKTRVGDDEFNVSNLSNLGSTQTLRNAELEMHPRGYNNDTSRRHTGMVLLAVATLLALLSGLLGALWLRERASTTELRDELANAAVLASEPATVDVGELEALSDEIRLLELENERLEQQVADMSALVLELPGGRLSEIAIPFTPVFADEADGRLIAVGETGDYLVWGEGVDGPITEVGNIGAAPTGLFVSRNRAWVSTEGSEIAVLTLANDSGPTFVPYGPTQFLAEEERGYWTFNSDVRQVARLQMADGQVTNSLPVPSDVVDLTIGAGSVWALGEDDLVYRINTADFTVQPIDAGEALISITAGPDSLWTLSAADGSLRRIDPVSGEVLVTVPVGRDPIDATVTGSSVWVALRSGQSLIEVDTRTSAVVSRTTLPAEPSGLHQGESGVFVTMEGDTPLVRVSSLTNTNNDDVTTNDGDVEAADAEPDGG